MLSWKKTLLLLAITFSLKLALGLYFSHLLVCQFPERQRGFIAIDGGDTFSYLDPIDNYIAEGEYYFWNGARKVSAGRMPYYGAPYFLLRLLFEKSAAYDIYVIIQILFDALAAIVFARLCFNVLPVKSAFWLGYVFYFSSFNFFVLSVALWTENLSSSFLVFFLYSFHCFWKKRDLKDAVWSSVFLALITTLKPYLVIIYPLFFVFVRLNLRKNQARNFSSSLRYLYQTAALGLPLLILLAPWIARNAMVLGKFIPAQENIWAGYNFSETHLAFAEFAGAWGGGSVSWDSADAGCYFLVREQAVCDYSIPEYALTDGYSRDEIERVRQNFFKLQDNYSSELDAATATEFARLTNIYRQEQPFRYYVGSKFIFLKKLFWHTNNYNLPIHPGFKCFSSYQLSFKIVQFGIYLLSLTLGTVGLVKITIQGKISVLFISIALSIIIFFLELRTSEHRYVSQIFPILLIGLTIFLCSQGKLLKSVSKIFRNFLPKTNKL